MSEQKAEKKHYAEIAERVRFHKQEDGEVRTVCRAFEEYGREKAEEARKEARAERNTEIAKTLLKKNKLTLEEIAEASELELEQVKKLANKGCL